MAIHSPRAYGFFYGFHSIKQDIGLGHPSARVLVGKVGVRYQPPSHRPNIRHSIISADLAQTPAGLNFSHQSFLDVRNLNHCVSHAFPQK
jgi:hypothetical protein